MKKIFTLFLGVIIAVNVWAEEETTTTITDNGNGIYSYVYSSEDGSTIIGLELVGVKYGATSLTIQTSITVEGTSYDVVSIASDAFSDKDNCCWVSKIYVSWDTPIDIQLDDTYLDSFNSTPYLYVPTTSIDLYFKSNWANYFIVSFKQDDYYYKVLTSDETSRTVSIIDHPSISGDYTLPSSVKVSDETTYDITEIVDWGFQSTGMTSLTIPNTYTTINGGAFLQNTQLTTVTFEEGSQLALFEQQLFNGCTALETIEIPSSVTSIGYATFNDCSSLKTVTFEEDSSLETIGEMAFYNCSSLIKIEIPSGVTTIYDDAFKGCLSLEDVTIPATVTYIGGGNFQGSSLTSLTITGDEMTTTLSPNSFNVSANSDCILYVNEGLERDYYNAGWGAYFTINNYIEGTEIADEESGLTYVISDQYNNEVTIVAFECSGSVTIPETVTYEKVSYTITTVATDIFNCESLKEVTMEAGNPPFDVNDLGTVADGVVLKVGDNQEAYKDWHGTFIIYGYVEEGDSFSDDVFTYTVLSDTKNVQITDLQSTATTFGIPTSVTYNGLDFTVTKIADSAFDEQTDLTVTVEFESPDTITLGDIASGNIGTLTVPSGSEWAFYNSDWATYFTISGDISFTTEDGFTYTLTSYGRTDVAISAYNGDGGDITIEPTVTADNGETYTIVSINEGVFTSATLSSVTVKWEDPTTVSPAEAFTEGSEVTLIVPKGFEVTYHDSVWGTYFAIDGYIEGTQFTVDNLTYEITDQYSNEVKIAGFTCAESVTIPASIIYDEVEYTITTVADGVFDCEELMEVTMEASEPPFDATAFENIAKDAVLIVPEGAKEAYSSWGDSFIEILDGTESLTTLININSEKKEVVRYNLLGQKINAPMCGINIIKYSDGTVEKVLVK